MGAGQGLIVTAFNFLAHKETTSLDNNEGNGPGKDDPNPNRNPKQDKKLTPGEIEKMKDKGWDHGDKKSNGKGGGGNDLWKDSKGNVYEKPKSGAGWGEWTGYNLNLTVKVGIGTTIVIGAKFIFDKLSSKVAPFLMITPIMMYQVNPNYQYQQIQIQ